MTLPKSAAAKFTAILVPLAYLVFYTPYGMDTTDFGYFYAYPWRILEGQIPYRDFFYIKPALPLYWHAFWLWLTPEKWQVLAGKAGFVVSMLASSWLGALTLGKMFNLRQIGLPLPLHFFFNLIRHLCRRSILLRRIGKYPQPFKFHLVYKVYHFLMFFFCLPGKSGDQRGSKADIRDLPAQLLQNLNQLLLRRSAAHPFQDPVIGMLDRQIQVMADLRLCLYSLNQLFINFFLIFFNSLAYRKLFVKREIRKNISSRTPRLEIRKILFLFQSYRSIFPAALPFTT